MLQLVKILKVKFILKLHYIIITLLTNKNFIRISGKRKIKRQHSLVTENVLDKMHVSYVHSFENQMSPIPFKIKHENIGDLSGKTTTSTRSLKLEAS